MLHYVVAYAENDPNRGEQYHTLTTNDCLLLFVLEKTTLVETLRMSFRKVTNKSHAADNEDNTQKARDTVQMYCESYLMRMKILRLIYFMD